MHIDVDDITQDDLLLVQFEDRTQFGIDEILPDDWEDVPLLRTTQLAKGRNGLVRAMGKVVEEWVKQARPWDDQIPSTVEGTQRVLADAHNRLAALKAAPVTTSKGEEYLRGEQIKATERVISELNTWMETLEFLNRWVVGHSEHLVWSEYVGDDPFMEHLSYDGLDDWDNPLTLDGGFPSDLGRQLFKALKDIRYHQSGYVLTITPVTPIS